MKRLFCLALVLLMLLPLFSVTASASEDTATVTVNIFYLKGRYYGTYTFTMGNQPKVMHAADFVHVSKAVYEFECFRVGSWYPTELVIPAYDGTQAWKDQWSNIEIFYDKHTHSYAPGYDRKHHWDACACGDTIHKKPHVDPAEDEDKICDCGYVFSNNADLTTLWLEGMVLSTRFDKDITDYTAKVHTYRDYPATRIVAQTFDDLATVELPKDLTLKNGANTFQITVTAEDKTTTKTYTVTAVKPITVLGKELLSDGETAIADVGFTAHWADINVDVPNIVLTRLADVAKRDGCSRILVRSDNSRWGSFRTFYTFEAQALKSAAETAQVDLVIRSSYGFDVTISHDAMTQLAEAGKDISVVVTPEGGLSIQADGKELNTIPEGIVIS